MTNPGFALLGLIYMTNHLTMAQFNPAVTIAFYLHGMVKSKKSLLQFICAEMLGGAVGGVLGREIRDQSGASPVHNVAKVGDRVTVFELESPRCDSCVAVRGNGLPTFFRSSLLSANCEM